MFQPSATLTAHNAQTALLAGLQAIEAGQQEIDLGQLTAVDSAAVATLLAWKRAASERGAALVFQHMPTNLRSLADLYGVSDLLGS